MISQLIDNSSEEDQQEPHPWSHLKLIENSSEEDQ